MEDPGVNITPHPLPSIACRASSLEWKPTFQTNQANGEDSNSASGLGWQIILYYKESSAHLIFLGICILFMSISKLNY